MDTCTTEQKHPGRRIPWESKCRYPKEIMILPMKRLTRSYIRMLYSLDIMIDHKHMVELIIDKIDCC